MKIYYIEPGKTAVCIITKTIEIAKYVAEQSGLIKVSWAVWNAFRLNHDSKVLVL